MKILFLLAAKAHTPNDRNMNHFQRVYFLSRDADLTVLGVKGADFSVSAAPGMKIIEASSRSKLAVILKAFQMAVTGRARQYDIILSEPSLVCLGAFALKLFSRAKWVVDVWDIPIRCLVNVGRTMRAYRALTRFLLKTAFKRADLFLLSIMPDFEFKYFKVPERKMFLLPNAIWRDVEPGPRKPAQGVFELVAMRTFFSRDMGLDVLAKAFLKLEGKIENLRLTLVGRMTPEVEDQIAPLRGKTNVEFIESTPHDKVMEIIGRSRVCVIPYRDVVDLSQILPIKVLEYLVTGVPIVASDLPNMRRMIRPGKDGLLFKPGDSDDLERNIFRLYEDTELSDSIRNRSPKLDPKLDCRTKNKRIVERLKELVRS